MIKKITLILGIVLVIGGGAIFASSSSNTSEEQKIFTSDKITNLQSISLEGNFDINVTTSDSNDIKCKFIKTRKGYMNGSSKLNSSIENNILTITTNAPKDAICIGGSETLKLDIDIPKRYKNKLFIKSKLNKINILNSNSKNIQCNTQDSNIKISLDNICGDIAVKSNLGNIDLELPKDQKFNLSANSHLGKITNKLASNVDSSLKEKVINLSSSSGNITISQN
ncbi:hypothetical protein N494_07805 [Clostridium botulinum A2B7 92]|uniref:DUF4097 family beta strand repeat-containing protein n=1 Tax=Clostridium botulinum TaxID=1491 RepID=UPI0007E16318|nr:DUF4097 family beta strand repeat-containing protein [Clostridium botulinum]KEJ00873.1 hypothetical protein N494_07805 [Clostridium botulinum A2B7 92]